MSTTNCARGADERYAAAHPLLATLPTDETDELAEWRDAQ